MMAVKDHKQHFDSIQVAPTPSDKRVPNTVSRAAKTGDRALTAVIAESGKPVLDTELNLHQAASWMENFLLRRWQAPSGWLRGRTHHDVYCDWIFEAPAGLVDDTGETAGSAGGGSAGGSAGGIGGHIHADGTLLNAVVLPRLEAMVAGHPVVVEFTGTRTPGFNLVGLLGPRVYDGTSNTVKRTDFIFLEVWKALVAPSPRASGQIEVVSVSDIAAGDIIRINGIPLTAVVGAPGVDEFTIGVDETVTAANIVVAINDIANSFDEMVIALSALAVVTVKGVVPGEGDAISMTGNFITLSLTLTTIGSMVISGATLTGGADRPNKPDTDQTKLFRHGNVMSPAIVGLDDELVDPVIDVESSQRVQLQYRIRVTGTTEAVNYKKHPDGFSNLNAGTETIYGQGNRNLPVHSGNGVDTLSYPFVRADQVSVKLDSSAVAYGWQDDGLWIAGDGSEAAAQALGALDGFVYAIPLGFVFRHNNVSDALAGFKGFNASNNANGAPEYDHAGYSGSLGVIPAGVSDRPDNHFSNVITQDNLLDLRRHVVFPGIDMAAELQYQMQSLLDGNLRTWAVDTASKQDLGGGSGDVSTRFLICNEIGRSNTVGGDDITAGDIQRGVLVRNYDHISRRFGDQPVVERVIFAFWPGDRDGTPVAPGTDNPGKYVSKNETAPAVISDPDAWYEGDTLVLDLEFFNSTTLGGLFDSRPGAGTGGGGSGTGLPSQNFLPFAPAGTIITDVLSAYHDDGHFTTAVDQKVQMGIIKGLGTTKLEVTLDANDQTVNGGDSGNPDQKMVGRDEFPTLAAGTDFDFVDSNPDTIVRNDAGDFIADGFLAGMTITVANATDPANDGTYTIAAGGVAVSNLTLVVGDTLTASNNDLTATLTYGPLVPVTAPDLGSTRRVFLEVEITYPLGAGLTDTPDYDVDPDAAAYDGTGAGPGPQIENTTSQRPNDFEFLLEPHYRRGFREVQTEYVANDTIDHPSGASRAGTPVGGVSPETLVSRNRIDVVFPRRLFSTSDIATHPSVTDAVAVAVKTVDTTLTEFGSSSRLLKLDGGDSLSGLGQTLCDVEYFAQDPIPNYGVNGGGWQIAYYFRSNAPQTAGTKEGDINTTGDGTTPTTLTVEPLITSTGVWTGQVGMGGHDLPFPYTAPLDQIPIHDGATIPTGDDQIAGTTAEWFFAATASVVIDDFNADTGLLNLHAFVQQDIQNTVTFGGLANDEKPRKDAEFRAYYPFADDQAYRPTIMAQPLSGAVRHKVFVPFLARATEDVPGVAGGVMYRKSELLLIVLSRFAELDDNNNVLFVDPAGDNRTLAAVYRTRNLLLTVGGHDRCLVT